MLVTVVVNIPSLRSTTSITEKRNLAEFPEFSIFSLLDGSYFSDISLWFSDTVPARDVLTSANMKIQNFLGITGAQTGFNEGQEGDDIPVPGQVIEDDETLTETTTAAETTTATITETATAEITTSEKTASETVTEKQNTEEKTTAENTEEKTTKAKTDSVTETLGSIAIVDNAGYEYYNFVQDTADIYIKAVNRAGKKLAGTTNVYCMVIPLSTDIILDESVRKKLSVSDQRAATDYMYGSMNDNVNTIEVYNTLKEHNDEYIYFRTDHHWTALGAYYAYVEYCKSAGKMAVDLEDYKLTSFDNFLGTFYNDSGQSPALAKTPDRVDTYYPPCKLTMKVTDVNGNTSVMPLIYDESKSTLASVKYGAFLGGDNPYCVITNESEGAKGSCVVVKESFGNAFVPFLVPNYKKIYVIDYRYWDGSITEFCTKHKVKDLLFCNNISATRSKDLMNTLSSKIS